jgi:pyruvate dehydrogenase E1 component
VRGLYRLSRSSTPQAQVLASGIAVRLALQAQELLKTDWGVDADIWSVTSWNELRRDALASEEHALLRPDEPPRTPFVTEQLLGTTGPVVAVSDWMRGVPDQISRWVPTDYASLGTDGFGRSDTRAALRRHFHIDAESVAVAVLRELARRGEVPSDVPAKAVERYHLHEEQVAPAEPELGAT